MYLSKISYSPDHRAEMVKALTQHRNLFYEHEMIWNLMPHDADAKRDFLYRKDQDQKTGFPFYYVLSERKPKREHDFLLIDSKEFSPQLVKGGRYGFSLRANAVITRKADDTGKRRIRRDIIEACVDDYKQRLPDPDERPPSAMLHHEAGKKWLDSQGERHGFRPLDLMVSNHNYCEHHKPGENSRRKFSSLDFDGVLEITDADRFMEAMYTGQLNPQKDQPPVRGLGRSKAFGCGLMLIRKA